MAIAPIGNNALVPFGGFGVNQVQQLGMFAISMLALNVISNIPMAGAKETQGMKEVICEKICEPLPGGKDDIPERICQETCKKGAEIIKTTTSKEIQKNGVWKVASSSLNTLSCTLVCSPEEAAKAGLWNAAKAGFKWAFMSKEEALKEAAKGGGSAACSAMLVADYLKSGVGTALCYACCVPLKYIGAI